MKEGRIYNEGWNRKKKCIYIHLEPDKAITVSFEGIPMADSGYSYDKRRNNSNKIEHDFQDISRYLLPARSVDEF